MKTKPKSPTDSPRVDLTTTLYDELHRLAVARMFHEYEPQTLQATALVHEAWLRMGGDAQPEWANRKEFIMAAARTMRQILIDRARRRQAICHGGGQHRVEMDAWNWERLDLSRITRNDELLIALDKAFRKLASVDHQIAQLTELHYFGGIQIGKVAEIFGMSRRTAERRLSYARALLEQHIEMELED